MLGVVIVAYSSADVIVECLESLMAAPGRPLKVVVVDNASPDETLETVRAWAGGEVPFERPAHSPLPPVPAVAKPVPYAQHVAADAAKLPFDALADVTVLRSACNLGFAGGVNLGLKALARHPEFSLFWVLNPDSVVPGETPGAYLEAASAGRFALMGCRTVFYDPPDRIQTDGGRVRPWIGACRSVHQGRSARGTPVPQGHMLDYISGANMVASRAFLERAGPMVEDYFLYYEEVDWAFRRGDLPLVFLDGPLVYHHGGTAIGTGTLKRPPSPFANYFNYRNRMRFLRRFQPSALATGYLYSLLKTGHLGLKGFWPEAVAAFCGLHGLSPPAKVRARLAPEAAALAFARARR